MAINAVSRETQLLTQAWTDSTELNKLPKFLLEMVTLGLLISRDDVIASAMPSVAFRIRVAELYIITHTYRQNNQGMYIA